MACHLSSDDKQTCHLKPGDWNEKQTTCIISGSRKYFKSRRTWFISVQDSFLNSADISTYSNCLHLLLCLKTFIQAATWSIWSSSGRRLKASREASILPWNTTQYNHRLCRRKNYHEITNHTWNAYVNFVENSVNDITRNCVLREQHL
jgi:hypothetical protein